MKPITPIKPPAPRPCETCPYRLDCPSGVWDPAEYHKLPAYDLPTAGQPSQVFLCHEHGNRACAGWAGCHDTANLLSLRLALVTGAMTPAQYAQSVLYVSPVPLFASGRLAAEHGLREVETPSAVARRVAARLVTRRRAQGRG